MRTRQSGPAEGAPTAATSGRWPSSARVVGLSSAAGSSILTVRLPDGVERDLVLPAAPDPLLARRLTSGFRRLAWTRIDLSDPLPRCRVSATYRQPRSQWLPLAAALALADAGVPTVVRVPGGEG